MMRLKCALLSGAWPFLVAAMLWGGWLNAQEVEIPAGRTPFSEKGRYRVYRIQSTDDNTTTLFPSRLSHAPGQASTFMSTPFPLMAISG